MNKVKSAIEPELNQLAASLLKYHLIDASIPETGIMICETKLAVVDDIVGIDIKWEQKHYDQFDDIKFPFDISMIDVEVQSIHPTYLFAFLECVRRHHNYDHLVQVHNDNVDHIYGVHDPKKPENE